jgi:hypothetical protein
VKTAEQYQDEILLMYQETKSLDRKSMHTVLGEEAGYVGFFQDLLQDGYDRGLFTGDPRLSADIVAYLCAIVVLRRWNLRRRFSPDAVRTGVVEFILRGLGGRRET